MAVRESDTMASEALGQRPRARRRDRSIDVEVLDGHAGAFELAGQPSLAVARKKYDIARTRGLERRRHPGDHHLRAARSIRLDEMGNAQALQVHGRGSRQCSPAVQASNALGEIPLGTLTRFTAHGSGAV